MSIGGIVERLDLAGGRQRAEPVGNHRGFDGQTLACGRVEPLNAGNRMGQPAIGVIEVGCLEPCDRVLGEE